jgi:hypothetical protein
VSVSHSKVKYDSLAITTGPLWHGGAQLHTNVWQTGRLAGGFYYCFSGASLPPLVIKVK